MLALAILACGNSVLVETNTAPCENWDFDSSEASYELVEDGAGAFTVRRDGHLGACDDRFAPEIDARGTEIVVKESWTGGDDASCSTCLVAMVTVTDAPDKLVFYWFDDSSSVKPAFTVD